MKNTQILNIKRIRGGSVIKGVILGTIIGMAFFGVFISLGALTGVSPITVNGKEIVGIQGFFYSILLGFFMSIFWALTNALFVYIGLRIYSFFRPISIEYIAYQEK